MTLFMRALIWAACVPLLTPPGVCHCRAFAAKVDQTESNRLIVSENVKSSKKYCHCQKEVAETNSQLKPTPLRGPAKPCPKCVGVDPINLIEPCGLSIEQKQTGSWFFRLVEGFDRRRFEDRQVHVDPSVSVKRPIPLFLSHCALVI